MRRRLVLRKATLTELTADDLSSVAAAAGADIPTFQYVQCETLLRPCAGSRTCAQ